MKLNKDISRIKEVMGILNEQTMEMPEDEKTISITGKIIDLENLSDEDKSQLKLRERIVIDNNQNEYPIVLVQTRDEKLVMFDIDGSIRKEEKNDNIE